MNEVRLAQASVIIHWWPHTMVAQGVLVDDHPTDDSLKAGTHITTSPVVAIVEGVVVITLSGTRYRFV